MRIQLADYTTREIINALMRHHSDILTADTMIYWRDCYDHSIQIRDFLETYREMAARSLEIYLTSVSNRMNEVMKLLTIIATIFIPLTFIVGVYGMNFDRDAGPFNMPELSQPYGYTGVWVFIILSSMSMLALFRYKRWL